MNILGKGKSEKILVKLPKTAYQALKKYLAVREKRAGRLADDSPLFASLSDRCRDKALSTRTISRIAKKSLTAAGFTTSEYCCHSLRHTSASIAINARDEGGKRIVSTRDVKNFLRHSSEKVTEVYLHDEQLFSNPCSDVIEHLLFAC